jgi:hypothetical protein
MYFHIPLFANIAFAFKGLLLGCLHLRGGKLNAVSRPAMASTGRDSSCSEEVSSCFEGGSCSPGDKRGTQTAAVKTASALKGTPAAQRGAPTALRRTPFVERGLQLLIGDSS